jgi:hypothetical protein
MPEGSWDVRIRDLDHQSPTYGSIIQATAAPTGSPRGLRPAVRPPVGRSEHPTGASSIAPPSKAQRHKPWPRRHLDQSGSAGPRH